VKFKLANVELAIWQCEIHNLTRHFSNVELANRKCPIGKVEEQEKSTGQNNGAFGIP
jgi:hypothetical protein